MDVYVWYLIGMEDLKSLNGSISPTILSAHECNID